MSAKRCSLLSVGFHALIAIVSASQARASYLEGEFLTLQIAYPTSETIYYDYGPLLVGPGPEATPPLTVTTVDFVIDISDSSILILYPENVMLSHGTFNGFIIQAEAGSIDPFRDVTINPSTTVAGFSNPRLWWNDYEIFINLTALNPRAGNFVQIDVSPIPEPGSLMLLIVGSVVCIGRTTRFVP